MSGSTLCRHKLRPEILSLPVSVCVQLVVALCPGCRKFVSME